MEDHNMRSFLNRRARRPALVTVALPVAAWALEQAAQRVETRDPNSSPGRRLRLCTDFVQRYGRGPLGDQPQRRPTTTVTLKASNRHEGDQHGC
jgi:hypothetical protein